MRNHMTDENEVRRQFEVRPAAATLLLPRSHLLRFLLVTISSRSLTPFRWNNTLSCLGCGDQLHDKDRSGYLDIEELATLCQTLGSEVRPASPLQATPHSPPTPKACLHGLPVCDPAHGSVIYPQMPLMLHQLKVLRPLFVGGGIRAALLSICSWTRTNWRRRSSPWIRTATTRSST